MFLPGHPRAYRIIACRCSPLCKSEARSDVLIRLKCRCKEPGYLVERAARRLRLMQEAPPVAVKRVQKAKRSRRC